MNRLAWPGPAVAAFVLAVFAGVWFLEDLLGLIPGYRGLFEAYGYTVPRSLLSLAEIVVVLAAVCLLYRTGPAAGARQLGARPPVLRSLGFAAAAVAPMAAVFAVTHELAPDPALELVYLSLISPVAEEVVFRGFLFGQLWRAARWGQWPSIVVSSLVFGIGHAEDAGSLSEGLALLALTGLGAAVFAWVYSRWGSLVAPIALHVLMNLCWSLWQPGDGAVAGWLPFALQTTTVVLAIGLTLVASRRGWTGSA